MAAKMCNICNKRRVYTGTGLNVEPAPVAWDGCNLCYTEGGYENQHSDSNHDGIIKNGPQNDYEKSELADFMPGCWICHPELNLAQKPQRAGTGPKTQGTRRPQFNHKGHTHPQSPAARRACKNAFWASLTPVANVSTEEQVAEAMAEWNYHCDAFGKPVEAPKKPSQLFVAPLGTPLKKVQAKVDAINARAKGRTK